MKKLIAKPHLFFFGLIPIVLILGILFKEEAIDINVSYTYFVITYNNLSYVFAVFFGLVGLNYFSLHWGNKTAKKWLTITHIFLQTIALILFFTKNNWNWLGTDKYSEEINTTTDYSNLILAFAILIFIISAFVHLINFFSSLFSKSK
ncbi:hypothetical protein [Polaribacter uvawellassae]|uniref:hypothetical protein n=1 Tax=Polaribacter uvawellassae TaxID=3133495 RepID=UPI00321B01E1